MVAPCWSRISRSRVSKGFLQSEVLGEVSVSEGGSSGRSFHEVCDEVFHKVLGLVYSEQKNFSENFSPKFPWLCTAKVAAKLEKFQGKTS